MSNTLSYNINKDFEHKWAVLPNGGSNLAILVYANDKIIFFFKSKCNNDHLP